MADTNVKTLNIIEINVSSIIKLSQRLYLSNFINRYNSDLLNETKLNFKHSMTFKDYNKIRKNRADVKRGL